LSVDDRSTVTISGGQVDAGVDVGAGRLDVAGGTIRGYQAVPGGYSWNALTITSIAGASVHVAGGTFIGGDSTGDAPGSGIANYGTTMDGKMYLSTLNIDGGTFVGGNAAHSDGYSLISGGNTTITGGDFQSSILIPSNGGTTTFLGSDLAYNDSTHILSGILRNGDPIHVLIDPMRGVKVDGSGSEIRFWSVSAYPIGNPSPPDTTPPLPDPVPEPATITIFILVSAGGLARSRRLARGGS
jgi:hypothetical protein